MKAKELRTKSLDELQRQLEDLKDQLFRVRFQKISGNLENPNLIRQIKKDIARINTLLAEARSKAE